MNIFRNDFYGIITGKFDCFNDYLNKVVLVVRQLITFILNREQQIIEQYIWQQSNIRLPNDN